LPGLAERLQAGGLKLGFSTAKVTAPPGNFDYLKKTPLKI
jgi:hypothetical protein